MNSAITNGLLAFALTPLMAVAQAPTHPLDGVNITYQYSGGRAYNVKFEAAAASYRYLTGSKPEVWWGPFPYQAIEIAPNQYFASWFEEGYGDYVTLLINFDTKVLHGSAIIRGEEVHLQAAIISEISGR